MGFRGDRAENPLIIIMKIEELFKGEKYGNNCRAREWGIINQYKDKECVVAYLQGPFGMAFIIRSARKFYAFVAMRKDIYFGGFDYKLTKIEIPHALKIMGDKIIIEDEELYGIMKKRLIVDNL